MHIEQRYQSTWKEEKRERQGLQTDSGTPQLLDIYDKTRNARIINGSGIISVVMSKAVS